MHTIFNILNNDFDPSFINYTYICLVPNVKQLENAKIFRPVSLCNIIIKIVTKMITNRLKSVIMDLIHKT